MLSKLIIACVLLSATALGAVQLDAPKLPDSLTDSEKQAIARERGTRDHVEAALKLADARLTEALRLAEGDQYKPAADQLAVHAALIVYADAVARTLPEAQRKDRNHCFKRIEQAIFKQNRPLEAVLRELPAAERDALQPAIDQIKKIRIRALNDALGDGKMLSQ